MVSVVSFDDWWHSRGGGTMNEVIGIVTSNISTFLTLFSQE